MSLNDLTKDNSYSPLDVALKGIKHIPFYFLAVRQLTRFCQSDRTEQNLIIIVALADARGPKMQEPKVAVDVRLFVSCRLCLEVQGHFVIDPNVQLQIKYCFDIDVEPFDGLPQLICKKCENILREYYAIKKKFTEKQKELKTKLQETGRKDERSPSPQHSEHESLNNKTKLDNISSRSNDSDSSKLQVDYHENNPRKKKKVKKRIINRISSSSNYDSDSDASRSQLNSNAKKHSKVKDVTPWDADLNKYFVCRICSQGFKDKVAISEHIKEHSSLEIKFKNVFKTSCLVVMEKIDSKPNICNSNKAVVYSTDSIVQNRHNPFYYIKYHPKTYSCIPNTFESKRNSTTPEFSDGERLTYRKKRRLLSGSSSETVVINPPSEHEDSSFNEHINNPTVIDCIDLGDSSDNGSYESNGESTTSNKGKPDSKQMQNIIKICHNRYNKQIESFGKKTFQNDKEKQDLLQHKVLSIGRKIINNRGFNCTGLLRFLEYKDLSVIWKQTSVLNASNDNKYARIAMRLRGKESNDTNNVGWKKINSVRLDNDNTYRSVNLLKKLKALGNFKKKPQVSPVINEQENCLQQLPQISSVFSIEVNKAEADNQLTSNKLLNENPVSNPKQLPKKLNSNESHSKNVKENFSKKMKVFSAPNTVPFDTVELEENNTVETNTMPIVMSTVSLAHLVVKEKSVPVVDSVNTSNNQSMYPMIKVKPVSELMPEKITTNINSNQTYTNVPQNVQITNLWNNKNLNFNQSNSVAVSNVSNAWSAVLPKSLTNGPYAEQLPVDNLSQSSGTSDSAKDYIIMDTVEFPNKKTNSPFQYLKDLLLVHNIILLDANQPLPKDSITLINLRVYYQQENSEKITLFLSLFCFKNYFCIKFKDLNNEVVPVNNFTAHWQWQLLKIYNDDVITKILQIASTKGIEMLQYTTHFFNLLRSIKVINDTS